MKKLVLLLIFLALAIQVWSQDNEPAADSTQVANAVVDSLNLNTIPTDSAAIASELKKQANKALADSLNNYVDVPVALDSTLTDQAKQEAKKRLEEELNTNIPTDSAAVANKAASMANQTIKDETGIDIKGVPKDSASVAKEA
ncbi:hypothetical protein, partial [Fulvivirga lutimaris]|uniref:hypothetical protein n=1 Tax=Fulvivirga lutimaris TaxID=1819566 RepID=UPI001C86F884